MEVTAEVGCARESIVEYLPQRLGVRVAEAATQKGATQERRIPDNELGLGPAGFLRLRRGGHVEERVAVFDLVERTEDRVPSIAQAVADHPLDLADPDGHAGKLGGVGVEFDAENDLGPDVRNLLGRLKDE